jgi:hypothetical protein
VDVNADREGRWSTLGFEEAALTEFRFLVTEYGFTQAGADPSCVSFDRHGVSVTIRQDRESFELTVTVERKETGERFSIWEIARLHNALNVTERTLLQASSRDRVEKFVPELARVLRTYGQDVLRGDLHVFQRLREQQVDESSHFLREGRLRWIREQLPDLWQRQDYEQIVKLLEEVGDQSLPSELAKLAYARKHVM